MSQSCCLTGVTECYSCGLLARQPVLETDRQTESSGSLSYIHIQLQENRWVGFVSPTNINNDHDDDHDDDDLIVQESQIEASL